MLEFEDKEEAPRDWFNSPGGVTEGNSAMETLSHLMPGERAEYARPTPELEAAVLRRQLSIAKVAAERADADLAQAGTNAAQARARYESIQAEIRGYQAAA